MKGCSDTHSPYIHRSFYMKKQILLFEAIYDSFQKYSRIIHTYYEIYGIINYEYKAIIGSVIVNNNQSNIFIMLFTDEKKE